MTSICGKWLKYLRNLFTMLEMTLEFVKRLIDVGNDVHMWEMAQTCLEIASLFDKRHKNVDNDLDIWEMAQIFGKWLRYMGHGLSIRETSLLCWKWLENLTDGLNMWKMTNVYEKWLKYLRKG